MKMITDEKLAELLKKAWRDGYECGGDADGNVVDMQNEEEAAFEVLRMPQLIDEAQVHE